MYENILDKILKIIFETDLFADFVCKNARRLRFQYQINCKAAQNVAYWVFIPHPIIFNIKIESVFI